MGRMDFRATLDEAVRQEPSRILKALVAVLLAELNEIRGKLSPPLAPLTASDILAKLKARL